MSGPGTRLVYVSADLAPGRADPGFDVRVVDLCADLTDEEISRYGLDRTGPLFFCTPSTPRHA